MKIDKHGYAREPKHSNAWHRKVAYYKIYLKDRKKYPLPFEEYEIHHKDGDKLNNNPDNLLILTPEEHIDAHLEKEKQKEEQTQKEYEQEKAIFFFQMKKLGYSEEQIIEEIKAEKKMYGCSVWWAMHKISQMHDFDIEDDAEYQEAEKQKKEAEAEEERIRQRNEKFKAGVHNFFNKLRGKKET